VQKGKFLKNWLTEKHRANDERKTLRWIPEHSKERRRMSRWQKAQDTLKQFLEGVLDELLERAA